MEYDRKKESDPRQTVLNVRNILRSLDIYPEETWNQRISTNGSESNAFSLRLHADEFGMSTNGKGSTREYALASAYGEFMERLQNMFLLPTERISREAMKYGGFLLFPDECLLTQDAVCNAKDAFSQEIVTDYYQGTFLLECRKKERMQVLCDYGADGSDPEEMLVAWPFYSVKENRVVDIWQRYVWMQGSNGMCAGNTPAEALVQGFSEIFERYAIAQVLSGNAVPPDIPQEEYLCYNTIRGIISEIESMGNYRILVKDCSLGKELPVCAVVLMDKEKKRYRASFGCHPSRPVAIERCLTELLQGYDPGDGQQSNARLIPIDRDCAQMDPYVNLLNMFSNGMGVLPYGFFTDPPTSAYVPAKDVSGESNQQMLRQYVSLALTLSDDILIRDVSYLGFPAYMILIPGVSHPRVSRHILRRKNAYSSLFFLQQYRKNKDDRALKFLLAGLNMWESRSSRTSLELPVYRVKAAVLLMLGRLEELITCLEYFLPIINEQEEHTEMSALTLAIRLKNTGRSMQQMEQMIIAFYSAKVWDKLRLCWLCDDPLDKLLASITDKDMENTACSALLVRLKERFSHTTISQQSLRSLFNP